MLYILPIPSPESSLKTSLYFKCFSLSSGFSPIVSSSFGFEVFKILTSFFPDLQLFLFVLQKLSPKGKIQLVLLFAFD